eukprot:SAG22_NODE_844_length_6872_cov_10.004577_2_plen_68_part_00
MFANFGNLPVELLRQVLLLLAADSAEQARAAAVCRHWRLVHGRGVMPELDLRLSSAWVYRLLQRQAA